MAVNRTSKTKGKVVDIPANAPTIGTAIDGGTGTTASVVFTAPSTTTGGPISSYTALSNPGSFSNTGASSPITISGLSTGTAYTFTVAGTNPTGNSPYSAASNSVTPITPPSYESIATTTLSSSNTVITFSSIPGTFKHLQIRLTAKLSANGYPQLRFNGDTASNYSYHFMYGDGSLCQSGAGTSTTNIFNTYAANATNPTVSVIDIYDYANTNKYKTTRSLNGQDNNGTGFIWLFSGNWRNTAAVTSITLTTNDLFTQYSSFALYGVK